MYFRSVIKFNNYYNYRERQGGTKKQSQMHTEKQHKNW